MAAVDEKSMLPTILVGVGGTGYEVLARVRRLVEETYGKLENFPILGFLIIDTDKDYKVTNPEAAGSPFKDNEKYWARVSGKEAQNMVENMGNYPWIQKWFPNELERNLTALEAGAGQIRACGRFAFFFNYAGIKGNFQTMVRQLKGHENTMLDRYGIKVGNGINVFVTGSLSGGTGSGMILDLGYCIRDWLKGEQSVTNTAIVPTPNAFAGISVGERVLANGYAALMELSYFSDHRTEYIEKFNRSEEVRNKKPPFDFTYLVGTKNGQVEFKLDQVREMIAQNIFLDLTSDFAPHKRSIRDNIKSAWANPDPGGRGYPKNFMSFGLSTIEIPIVQIRSSLCNRLAQDLVNWWLNDSVQLPPQMLDLVRGEMFKKLGLSEGDLLAAIAAAQDRPYGQVIAEWVSSLRKEIAEKDLLHCTLQGLNVMGQEKGKILTLVDRLQEQISAYRADHLRDMGPDERTHGDYLKRMYGNRDQVLVQGRAALDEEFYRMVEDRTRGPKFAADFILTARQELDNMTEKLRREQEKVWLAAEKNQQYRYDNAIQSITEFKTRFGVTKQAQMETYSEEALKGLEAGLVAFIQRKARAAALEVVERWQDHLNDLEQRLNQWRQRMVQARDYFKERADSQAQAADALVINGIKLYDRQELNQLYQDLIEQGVGASQGTKSRYDLGLDTICGTLSLEILQDASPLWKENRAAGEYMQLLDVIAIPLVQEEDWRDTIQERTRGVVVNAPNSSKLKQEMAACDLLFRVYSSDADIVNNIRIAYQKSSPLILLRQDVMNGADAGFTPSTNVNVAILGGRRTADPAAQKFIPKVQQFVANGDDIKPLGDLERHRIVFVQEVGGFSLRCMDGFTELREAYQDWKGQFIEAKRAQLDGEHRQPPIPVHIQKDPPFWDLQPEDPNVLKLVVLARTLDVLWQDVNQATEEQVIRYQETSITGTKNIDLASTWEEVVQVLQVSVCRPDREKIQKQVSDRLQGAKTKDQKAKLCQVLLNYLQSRAQDLRDEGGSDSPIYKRENKFIEDTIQEYKLVSAGSELPGAVVPPSTETSESPTPDPVVVSNGAQPEVIDVTPEPPAILAPGSAPVPPAPTPTPDTLSGELEKLMGMVEKGFLTMEEFREAKRTLLDRYGS